MTFIVWYGRKRDLIYNDIYLNSGGSLARLRFRCDIGAERLGDGDNRHSDRDGGSRPVVFVISQLHKVAALLENGFKKRSAAADAVSNRPQAATVSTTPHLDLAEARERLAPLAAELGDSFELQQLYELANSNALPHVHLSIRGLRDSGVIIPAGDNRFVWS